MATQNKVNYQSENVPLLGNEGESKVKSDFIKLKVIRTDSLNDVAAVLQDEIVAKVDDIY